MAVTYDKSKVKVTPVRTVGHTKYNEMIGIRGHPLYFVNLLSGKITYRKGKLRIPTGKNTIMAAKQVVDEYLAQKASGKSIEKTRRDLSGVQNPSVGDIYREIVDIKSVGKEPATVKNYWKSWNYGLEFFWSSLTMNDCNDSNIEKFKEKYLEKNPERHFEHTGTHLNMMFRHAFKHGYIKKMPDMTPLRDMDEIIKKNKKWVKPGRVYSPTEVAAMKQAAKNISDGRHNGSTKKHKNLLAVRAQLGLNLGLVGLRMKEACALEWVKMDFKKKIMTVWSFKNHKWREVPMTNEIKDLLSLQKSLVGESRFVFPMPTDRERFISNQVFEKVWYIVKRTAGISNWDVEDRARFHDLRHTFATMTSELGWPPKVACDVLDMSMKEYDETYAKPGGAKKSEWMNRTWTGGGSTDEA